MVLEEISGGDQHPSNPVRRADPSRLTEAVGTMSLGDRSQPIVGLAYERTAFVKQRTGVLEACLFRRTEQGTLAICFPNTLFYFPFRIFRVFKATMSNHSCISERDQAPEGNDPKSGCILFFS